MKKVFGIAAILLALAACNKVETEIQPIDNAEGIPFSATISVGNNAATKALAESGTTIVATWAVDETVALIHNGVKDVMTVSAVNEGVATITGTITNSPSDGDAVTVIYPASAADGTTGNIKADLLYAQNGLLTGGGSIAANYDARKGTGTLKVSGTASLNGNMTLDNQFAIFKFTTKNSDGSATIDMKPLTVTIGAQDYVITPASATSELFVALPAIASQAVTFTATGSDGKIYTASKPSVSFDAGKYYQSPLKMTAAGLSDVISRYLRTVIGADGFIYATAAAATAAGTTAVAKIVYVGSDNGESAPYNHGLALALSDANGGSYLEWSTSSTKVHTYNPTSSSFESESGLQYNATHNSDTYPAFKAAIANNGTAAPTGCSAWFLASGYQWQKMAGAVGGYINLGLQLYRVYWSSTEYSANNAWYFTSPEGNWYNDGKGYGNLVRACLAF